MDSCSVALTLGTGESVKPQHELTLTGRTMIKKTERREQNAKHVDKLELLCAFSENVKYPSDFGSASQPVGSDNLFTGVIY